MRSGLSVCVVGGGPRGLSVVERLLAAARGRSRVELRVHIVDPYPPGPGAVWRTRQSGLLLMNTVAAQVTMFTDETVDMAGSVAPGPSLYDWARLIADTAHPVADEAGGIGPDTYPTRAFYGHYLHWVFDRVLRTAPEWTTVRVHQALAVELAETGAGQHVRLDNGNWLAGLDAVVLAQGHRPLVPTAAERDLAAYAGEHGLRLVSPANPADVDLDAIPPGETVAVRGLGLNFFDHVALLTVGRGGRFTRSGGLRYRPSGREPVIVAGSRRGIPYHARGENQKGPYGRHEPLLLTLAAIDRLRADGPADFRRDVWPLIAREVETVYYATAIGRRDGPAAARLRTRYPYDPDTPLPAGIAPWDWAALARPGRDFTALADFQTWLLAHLRADIAAAKRGNVGDPVKSALDVLRDLRNEVRMAVDHGGLTGPSHRDDLDGWYTPLNAYLSIGPPVSRVEEAVALIEAGVLTVVGPGMAVHADGEFVVTSAVPGVRVRARTLIEAQLPEPNLRRTADPLLHRMLAGGQCRPFARDGYETGGMDVTERPYHVIDAAGLAHPRRFAFGVPTEGVRWVTAAGIRPGVNSVILSDADAIAHAVLAIADRTPVPAAVPEGVA